MTTEHHKAAKQRIFEAALALFARKGYAGVGVREIAKKAEVNISMINYYFGEKAGILKAIINECYDRYFKTIKPVGDEDLPLEEHIRKMIRTVIKFFKDNTELVIVAFDIIPLDIPEVMELKIKWVTGIREGMAHFRMKLRVDAQDILQESVGPTAIIAVILNHFQSKYAAEQYPQFKEYAAQLNDEFYERYANALADLFLYGYMGRKKKEEK
ncbi:MAG: TetR/AcrR family transcriptional regulator [candidate division WOR-3 bacterium]|nr:MAG: TetR/AcrR family transcriptional regulator [candidate division WOR-3 bacterium]